MLNSTMRAAAAAFVLGAAPVAAHGFTAGDLKIGHPWARAAAPMAKSAAGYLTITNTGKADDVLLGGATPAASSFELHETSMAGGVMRMRPLDKLVIHPGETVTIAPGGKHIMMMGLKQPFTVGAMIPATLKFQRAGTVKVEFKVQGMDAAAPAAGHAH